VVTLQTSIQELPFQILAHTSAILTQISIIFLNHSRVVPSLDHACFLSNSLSTHLPFKVVETETPLIASQKQIRNQPFYPNTTQISKKKKKTSINRYHREGIRISFRGVAVLIMPRCLSQWLPLL
jgi:hypothetical protein